MNRQENPQSQHNPDFIVITGGIEIVQPPEFITVGVKCKSCKNLYNVYVSPEYRNYRQIRSILPTPCPNCHQELLSVIR